MAPMKLEFGLVVVAVHDGMGDILDHKEDMDLAEDILVAGSQGNAVDILDKVIEDVVEEFAVLEAEEVVALDQVEKKVSSELDL